MKKRYVVRFTDGYLDTQIKAHALDVLAQYDTALDVIHTSAAPGNYDCNNAHVIARKG